MNDEFIIYQSSQSRRRRRREICLARSFVQARTRRGEKRDQSPMVGFCFISQSPSPHPPAQAAPSSGLTVRKCTPEPKRTGACLPRMAARMCLHTGTGIGVGVSTACPGREAVWWVREPPNLHSMSVSGCGWAAGLPSSSAGRQFWSSPSTSARWSEFRKSSVRP